MYGWEKRWGDNSSSSSSNRHHMAKGMRFIQHAAAQPVKASPKLEEREGERKNRKRAECFASAALLSEQRSSFSRQCVTSQLGLPCPTTTIRSSCKDRVKITCLFFFLPLPIYAQCEIHSRLDSSSFWVSVLSLTCCIF